MWKGPLHHRSPQVKKKIVKIFKIKSTSSIKLSQKMSMKCWNPGESSRPKKSQVEYIFKLSLRRFRKICQIFAFKFNQKVFCFFQSVKISPLTLMKKNYFSKTLRNLLFLPSSEIVCSRHCSQQIVEVIFYYIYSKILAKTLNCFKISVLVCSHSRF